MPIFQGRLITCLILSAFSAMTWADNVLVNTTADKSVDDEFCSLREAVSYVHQKNDAIATHKTAIAPINTSLETLRTDFTTKQFKLTQEQNKGTTEQDPLVIETLKKEIENPENGLKKQISDAEAAITKLDKTLEDFRIKGVNGCKSYIIDTADAIQLKTSFLPYEVNNVITVNMAVSITPETISTTNGDLSNLNKTTLDNLRPRTLIKAVGNHPLFMIDDGKNNDADNNPETPIKYISVSFSDIDFQGCSINFCDANGGIFFNKESLTIANGYLHGGYASALGGAIYNAKNAIFSGNQLTFRNNQASDGAAIYSEQPSLSLNSSLFTVNTAANNQHIVTVADSVLVLGSTALPSIVNSTFSSNIGTAISARKTFALKNLTIVLNTDGIDFNNESPLLYSSIVAGNNNDCLRLGSIPDDKSTYIANNIYQTGCDISNSANIQTYNPNHKQRSSAEKIVADTVNGKCASPPATGLLCPLLDNGGLTQTHKPRLLADYNTLDESPIVNKGASSTSIGDITCPSNDQRGLPRTNCDIGSVELQGLISATQGQDITYGQKATFDLFEKIGDGELFPAAYCDKLFGASSIVGGYKDGCARLVTFPAKGVVNFDNNQHQVLYTATLPDFHGFDKFSYGMTTTISRFSDADNDREVKVNVKVVSDPATYLSSKSLDTGSVNLFSLLMLSLLMVWRRTR